MAEDETHEECSEDEKKTHATECEKEIDLAHETINKNQEDYDKQLLSLASGFLALVIAFVKDLVPLKTAIHRSFFYTTLLLFGVCILSVLFSYQLSIWGHFKAKRFWENKECGDDNSAFPFHFANYVKWLNLFSGGLFFAAVVFLIAFIIINLLKVAG